MSAPRVSLLMPNRDNAPILDHVLGRLAASTQYDNAELVVVDDGSTDESVEIFRRWKGAKGLPELRLIEREHTEGGVVDALNAGLAAATGELVVQLDGDASMETPGWLGRMVDFFGSDDRIGVVTGKVIFDWGEIHTCGTNVVGPEGLHDRGSTITEPAGRRGYHQRVIRSTEEDDCPPCDSIAEVDGGIGACMMYRREVAVEVGGYDPGWAPVWFDDLDLTMVIRRHGLKVFYLPDVRVIHHVGRRVEDERIGRRTWLSTRRAIGRRFAPSLRRRLSQGLNLDRPPGKYWARLEHHYAYWREKWGFDMLNPDMDAVLERWGDTEVCWRYNPEMRAAGESIVAAYR